MPAYLRYTLFALVMASAAVIGMRVYLELNAPHPADPALPEQGPVPGAPENLPEFTLNDIHGEPRSIGEWAGQPLLINFWATWCAPCRREIPLLQQLHIEKTIAGIQVIGIAIDNLSDVIAFVGEFGVSYPNLVGEADAMQVSSLFGIDNVGLPFSVLTAADGNVLTVHIGELDAAQLAEIVSISKTYEAGTLPLHAARQRLRAL